MLYSHNGAYPKKLPHRLKFEDGTTVTDRETFTEEQIAAAGYVAVDNPPEVVYPNKLEWTGTAWNVREPNESEVAQQWQRIRENCQRQLDATDYKVIKAIEAGEAVDPVYVQYRQELRDLYNNVNDVDPWNVTWPSLEYPEEEDPTEDPV